MEREANPMLIFRKKWSYPGLLLLYKLISKK